MYLSPSFETQGLVACPISKFMPKQNWVLISAFNTEKPKCHTTGTPIFAPLKREMPSVPIPQNEIYPNQLRKYYLVLEHEFYFHGN